jgi:hypothetical protein
LPTRYEDVAPLLLANGWVPVPLDPGTKRPNRREWQHRAAMADADLCDLVRRELSWRGDADRRGDACGIVVPPSVVIVDIDITARSRNDIAWQVMCAELGLPPMVRVGASPKSLSVYGVARPVASRRLGGIDIFCGSGQLAAFGVHAKTGRPYAWSDSNPLNTRPEQLSRVSADAVERFIARVVAADVLTPAHSIRASNTVFVNNASGIASAVRVPYAATVRLNALFDRYDGRVRLAVRALIEEIGAEWRERHNSVVAICGRLVLQRWTDAEIADFLVPLVNDAYHEGDWTREVEDAVRHARARQVERLKAARTAGSARLARIMSGEAP